MSHKTPFHRPICLWRRMFEVRYMSHVLGKLNIAKTAKRCVHGLMAPVIESYEDTNTR
jgi:hypothetical protein